MNNSKRVIIFSAPSGSGKSTIINRIIGTRPWLRFSISATSRQPRNNEKDGVDYHFLSPDKFQSMVADNQFVEWEEVYAGTCYGTLKSEIDNIWNNNQIAVFDVDVLGGVNLKKIYGHQAMSIFIMPPSVQELERRLLGRGTDSQEAIAKRLARAELEISYSDNFDHIVVNDDLDVAVSKIEELVDSLID